MVKKSTSIVLIVLLVLSIGACGKSTSEAEQNKDIEAIVDDKMKAEYIEDETVRRAADNNLFVLSFALLNSKKERISPPAAVKVKIVNDDGETVYDDVTNIDVSNFDYSYDLLASVYIHDYYIDKGTSASGTIYFDVDGAGLFSFEDMQLPINGLPTRPKILDLPEMPQEISYYGYSNQLKSKVEITAIKCEISGSDLYIYFTGEKTYDNEGAYNSSYCYVDWKLYDSGDYVVDSGTLMTDKLYTGEKFKDKKEYAFGCITPGETYTLRISGVD